MKLALKVARDKREAGGMEKTNGGGDGWPPEKSFCVLLIEPNPIGVLLKLALKKRQSGRNMRAMAR